MIYEWGYLLRYCKSKKLEKLMYISIGNWLNNLGYIYVMEYYVFVKRMSIVFMY